LDILREVLSIFAPNSGRSGMMLGRFTKPFSRLTLWVLGAALSSVGLMAQDHHGADHNTAHGDAHATADHEAHGHDAAHEGEHGDFDAGSFIINHIADAHDIHLFGDVHIPLPVILHIEGHGLEVFMSNAFEGHGHGDKHLTLDNGVHLTLYGEHPEDGHDSGTISASGPHGETLAVFDASITKSVFGLILVLIFMVVLFNAAASSYKKRPGQAPKGLANAIEPLIIFLRDEVARPSIGTDADRFMPFLLTVFFFIFFSNLLGLIPFIGGFNITGTVGVTLVLATLVFLITNFSGNKHYWGHVLWMPGVPAAVKAIILTPIEVIGLFLKPTVLMIRLTANITAGHIIILAFTSLIFIFGKGGEAPTAGFGIGIFSTAFMIFMYCLELLVAFLQAYVFTLLAAIYFGDARQEAHH
jgi:F-type H+-transporting ATPase subunit a